MSTNGALTKISSFASQYLRQQNENVPTLEIALDAADRLGEVEIKKGSYPLRHEPYMCELCLREELAAPHVLWFRGGGKSRAQAVAEAVREAMVYIEARHG